MVTRQSLTHAQLLKIAKSHFLRRHKIAIAPRVNRIEREIAIKDPQTISHVNYGMQTVRERIATSSKLINSSSAETQECVITPIPIPSPTLAPFMVLQPSGSSMRVLEMEEESPEAMEEEEAAMIDGDFDELASTEF